MLRLPLLGVALVIAACSGVTEPSTDVGFTAVDLAAGGVATCALQEDMTLHCWGGLPYLQSPPPDTVTCGVYGDCYPTPTVIRASFPVMSLTVGGDIYGTHVCGVLQGGSADGFVECTGVFRPLEDLVWPIGGDGAGFINLPVLATSVSAGSSHWCSLDPAGAAWCWGRVEYGKRGLPVFDGHQWDLDANRIDGYTFSAITVGALHNCAIEVDGLTYCWGRANAVGRPQPPSAPADQCFSGPDCVLEPVPLVHQLRFRSIEAGSVHTCGLTYEGELYCWGLGALGQLGGGTADSPAPVRVGLPGPVSTFSVGGEHSCAVITSGRTYCWGSTGSLGLGGRTATGVAPIDGAPPFVELAAGGAHTCGRDVDRGIWCWGSNRRGQLGTGDVEDRIRPTRVVAP